MLNDAGGSSYPFKVPSSPRNLRILNFFPRIETTNDPYRIYNASILWDGVVVFAGTLKCKIGNQSTIEGQFYEGAGDFYFQCKNRSLLSVDYGGISFNNQIQSLDWINACQNYTYPMRPCAFPMVYNPVFINDEASVFEDANYYNYYHPYTGSPGQPYKISEVGWNNQSMTIVPMLYLLYVLDKVASSLGYQLVDHFFSKDPDWTKCVIYNSVNANNWASTFVYPYYNLNNLIFNFHLPRLTIGEFLTGLEKYLNINFYPDNKFKTLSIYSANDVLFNKMAIDKWDNVTLLSKEPDDKILGYTQKMNLDEDDPIYDGIVELEKKFFETNKGIVNSKNELPLFPGAAQYEMRYVMDEDQYYWMLNKQWVIMSSGGVPVLRTQYMYKGADVNLDTAFSTLFQGGNVAECNNKRDDWTKISPRLLYTDLIQRGVDWKLFGKAFTNNNSLYYVPNSPNGIFQKYWKKWMDWRMNCVKIKIVNQLSFMDISSLKFYEKKRIDGNSFIISDFQVTLKLNSISPTTLNCLTCP